MKAWFAVLGDPIAHSRSPEIHQCFARQFGIELRYERLRVPATTLAEQLPRLQQHGLLGANITLPLKREAFALSGSHTSRALAAKAVNVLHFEESAWLGDNTDGAGWRIDVEQRHGLCLAHKSVLILGAGGAVQGLLPILLEAGVASIDVRNRNQLRAQALCTEYGDERLQAGARLQRYDLVINGTAAGHHANSQEMQNPMLTFDAAWIDGDTIAYDLSYGPAAASFLHLAQEAGAKVIDGFGMLIEQAALAFARWHGLNPNAEAAYQELRR